LVGGGQDFGRWSGVERADEVGERQGGNEEGILKSGWGMIGAGDFLVIVGNFGDGGVGVEVGSAFLEGGGEGAGKGFGAGGGVVEGFEAEGSLGGVAGFGEVKFFEEVLENVDGGEAGHFAADEFG